MYSRSKTLGMDRNYAGLSENRRVRIMIRKAVLQDISRIAEIIVFGKRVAYRPIFQNDCVSFNELQVLSIIEEYRENQLLLENMLVYDDGIVKGVINQKRAGNDVEIYEFYVEPFFKRQGIGSALIRQVIEEAKEAGFQRIFLWVIQDNLDARRFYEAHGFVASGETCMIEGTDKTDMCYELVI